MRVQLESTSKLINLIPRRGEQGVPARVWEGVTQDGVKVHAFITRVAIAKEEMESEHEKFRLDLQECREPSAEVLEYPLRLIL